MDTPNPWKVLMLRRRRGRSSGSIRHALCASALVAAASLTSPSPATAAAPPAANASPASVTLSDADFRARATLFGVDRRLGFTYDRDADRLTWLERGATLDRSGFPASSATSPSSNGSGATSDSAPLRGALVLRPHTGQWLIELAPDAPVRPGDMSAVCRSVAAASASGPISAYRPLGADQEDAAASLIAAGLMVDMDDAPPQPVIRVSATGRALGRLTLVGPDNGDAPGPSDIVLATGDLSALPAVAGLVTQVDPPRMSPAGRRLAAWGVPHVRVADAARRYRHLVGRVVELEVGPTGVVLRAADDEAAWEPDLEPAAPARAPTADLERLDIAAVDTLRLRDLGTYGLKAAALGQASRIRRRPFEIPAGVAIPAGRYLAHVRAIGAADRLHAAITDIRFSTDAEWRAERLAALRALIQDTPVDGDAVLAVEAALREALDLDEDDAVPPLYVRTSTTSETLSGRTAPGVYATVANVQGRAALAHAIATVWASHWTERAVRERVSSGISPGGGYPAVLVQESISPQLSGVMVTARATNIEDDDVITLATVPGSGMALASGDTRPDEVVVNRLSGELTPIGTRRGRAASSTLTRRQIKDLLKAARALEKAFPSVRPLDVEWLLRGSQLFVVQVRQWQDPRSAATAPRSPSAVALGR